MGGGAPPPQYAVTVAIDMAISALKSEGASVSSEAMSDIAKALTADLLKPSHHITNAELVTLEGDLADSFSHMGATLGFLGTMAVGLNDMAQGHGFLYSLADAGVSYGGALAGGVALGAYCGGPLDPADAGCVFIGAVIGGNVAPALYHGAVNFLKDVF